MIDTAGLRSVVVAGGGLTGWCAAAALKRRAPFLDVTILSQAHAPDALGDRIACTLPSLIGFLGDLGIGLADGVLRTGSGYRLGTRFSGWGEGLPDYVHAYDRHGHSFGGAAFHLQWLRLARDAGTAPFDSYAPAAALARAGRFVPPSANTPFQTHEFGLTLDLPRFAVMLRAFARHVNVREMPAAIEHVAVGADGRIERVDLGDGASVSADLFIDATGADAYLRSAIDTARDDWRRWLPCDRVLLRDAANPGEPLVLTTVTAHAAGWQWDGGTQAGLCYAAGALSETVAERTLGGASGAPIPIRAGTRPQPWRGNCVAIGDAATEIEPLEWCNLHLALSAIDRLIAMLPGRIPTPVEAAEFNRQALAEAERVRDFVLAHYYTARRTDPMWRAIADVLPPSGLAHSLEQFAERGRLPFYEEETFARDSWAAVLLGQGLLPRRIDPAARTVPEAAVRRGMAQLLDGIASALPHMPTHAAYRAAQTRLLTP